MPLCRYSTWEQPTKTQNLPTLPEKKDNLRVESPEEKVYPNGLHLFELEVKSFKMLSSMAGMEASFCSKATTEKIGVHTSARMPTYGEILKLCSAIPRAFVWNISKVPLLVRHSSVAKPHRPYFVVLFVCCCCFWEWEWNSQPCTCPAGTVPLSYVPGPHRSYLTLD